MKLFQNSASENVPRPVAEVVDIVLEMYRHGWNERNGGNLSMIMTEEEVAEIAPTKKVIKTFSYGFEVPELAGKSLIVTASGSYFRNARKFYDRDFGLVRVSQDGKTLELLWGYEGDNRPTSEIATHLLCHAARLKANPKHRMITHAHLPNAIAMTHVLPPDDVEFTKILWKMQTESIVVFPEGVGVLPWMVCGGVEIGKASCEKMSRCKVVFWSQHGVFCSGEGIDDTFGLLETIEKAAEIYMLTAGMTISQRISDNQLVDLAEAFKVTPRKGVID